MLALPHKRIKIISFLYTSLKTDIPYRMEWKISKEPVDYEEAVAAMEARVQQIISGEADELIWLLEHPPLYTAGTSANDSDLLDSKGFPVYKTGRGGQYTYHGPGQRIAYVMLDLKKRTPDVRLFVKQLEECIIMTLAAFGVKGEIREGRVGVWVASDELQVAGCKLQVRSQVFYGYAEELCVSSSEGRGGVLYDDPAQSARGSASAKGENPPSNNNYSTESKIAALGIRLRRWVSYHGIAININPDLSHYDGIIPCGISEYGVTSLAALGINTTAQEFAKEFDDQLIKSFNKIFYMV